MKTVWTPDAEARLRSMAFGVAALDEISAAFGISRPAVETKLSKMKLRSTIKPSGAEMAVIELQLEIGTSPARIPVRTGIPRPVVEHYLSTRVVKPVKNGRAA